MARRKNDFYPTPSSVTEELLKHVQVKGTVLEICSGAEDISKVLRANNLTTYTNDIALYTHAQSHFDAASDQLYLYHKDADWVVTNPPFNQAIGIVKKAVEKVPNVAMLLRISFLEPTYDRQDWLHENPPNKVIYLPRISFTGDGKTDSVTHFWCVWDQSGENFIRVAKKKKK